MNDFLIEERISTLLSLIDSLQLDILKLEAKTVSKVIEKKIKQKDKIIREYYKELNTLINSKLYDIDKDLIKVITENAELYLKTDLETYKKAFKKGLIKSQPVITKANKVILAKSIKAGKSIIDNTIKELKINSNNQISNIITKAIYNTNKGIPREKNIIQSATEIFNKSINIKDNAGREWKDITAYVRMNVKSIGNKTYISQQEQLASDIGIPKKDRKIEVSSHHGSRPEHAVWQGRVYSYKDFVSICKPNTATGICGINCRHRYYEFIDGISKPVFTHYNEEEDKKRYEIQQKQRYIEANIRKYKQQLIISENMGLDTTKAKNKVSQWQERARQHTKEYNTLRRYYREKIN